MAELTSTVTVTLTDSRDPEVFESDERASIEASDAGELLVQTSTSVAIFARGFWVSARADETTKRD